MKNKLQSLIRIVLRGCVLVLLLAMVQQVPVQAATEKSLKQLKVEYDFGAGRKYCVGEALAKTMMLSNPDGSLYVDPATGEYIPDPAKVDIFLRALDKLYPRVSNGIIPFTATTGQVILIPTNSGTATMNYADESAFLMAAMNTGTKAIRTMASTETIGSTYVEVNVTAQHLYYYVNGMLLYDTDIVTGNISLGHNTPCGLFHIRAKQTNQNLVGANYVSFVHYWVPIKGNSIGIHDATWRKETEFGGDIYKYNGSHGCINVPLSKMNELYPLLTVGTPVLVFTTE